MVGPIDLQNVVSKAGNVEKAQYQKQQQSIVDIEQFAQETSEKAKLKEQQVQKAPSSEKSKLEDKQERHKREQEQKQAAAEAGGETAEPENDLVPREPDRGQHIDIKA